MRSRINIRNYLHNNFFFAGKTRNFSIKRHDLIKRQHLNYLELDCIQPKKNSCNKMQCYYIVIYVRKKRKAKSYSHVHSCTLLY